MRFGAILAVLVLATGNAQADAPRTVLSGVLLSLTTTTLEIPVLSSYTSFGFVQTDLKQTTTRITMPGLLVEGYLERSTSDAPIDWTNPASAKAHGKNGVVLFWPAGDLVRIKHPTSMVVSTGSFRAIRINPALIKKISKRPAEFDGYAAYRQPFYMPQAHAQCLSDSAPHFQCGAKYTYNGIWISCSPKVGAEELGPICARDYAHHPTQQEIGALTSEGNVFMLKIADE